MNTQRIIITGGSGFIGTNLLLSLSDKNVELLNVDKCKPKLDSQLIFWKEANILDREGLISIFKNFMPTIVVHLAARTDTASSDITDYIENTTGTENVLIAVKSSTSIERVIIASSQYVFFPKSKSIPDDDQDFAPHTVYGESKVITEKLTREANLNCIWTIIRPTNVWGPWNMRYPNELLRVINQRLYLHPGKKRVIKSFAYVKNLVHQINGIVQAEKLIVNGKVFYLGDYPMDSFQWVNGFSKQLTDRNAIIVPRFFLRFIAMIGDILGIMKLKFPMTTLRYLNMTTDYLTPMDKTITAFGLYSDSTTNNISETITWLFTDGQSFFPYWQFQKLKKQQH